MIIKQTCDQSTIDWTKVLKLFLKQTRLTYNLLNRTLLTYDPNSADLQSYEQTVRPVLNQIRPPLLCSYQCDTSTPIGGFLIGVCGNVGLRTRTQDTKNAHHDLTDWASLWLRWLERRLQTCACCLSLVQALLWLSTFYQYSRTPITRPPVIRIA